VSVIVAIGGASLVTASSINASVSLPLIVILMFVLTWIGFDTWEYILTRQEISDRLERGLSRIRRYLFKRNKEVLDYLVNSINDDPTLYIVRQDHPNGVRRTIQTIQSTTLAIASAALLAIFGMRLELLFVFSLIVFSMNFIILIYIGRRRFKKAFERALAESKFPIHEDKKDI